jgi:uncharacterized repeat protein (TIGR03803 family)
MRKLSWWERVFAKAALYAAAAIALPAQTFTTLHTFNSATDGSNSYSGLIQATDGNLYGVTYIGGQDGNGTLFKITTSGALATLHSFCSQSGCADGGNPYGGLVQATNGNFYGTTSGYGANGNGTIFAVAPGGGLTTLYSFCSQSACPKGPFASLIQANDGNLYGTTYEGGAYGWGAIVKIAPNGSLTTLYSFCSQKGCPDGFFPASALVQGTDGNLYGTTSGGGANGYGTVFKITLSGALTNLHSFGEMTGEYPSAGLIQGSDGNFYGTTQSGSAHGQGSVFKITASGRLTTLYSFCSQGNCVDGQSPYGGVIQATDSNFYGTTSGGGANGYGTVFKLTPRGAVTTLYSFCSQSGCADGEFPDAGLVQDTNGSFYGVTHFGGVHSGGTIFSLSAGLASFVKTEPTSGKVGAKVIILGTDLSGTTAVIFNGKAATFTVVSATEIKTTVPTSATSGTVEVTTPSGALKSNVAFRVP